LVTATHAIFHKENSRFAPVAVVGFQFQQSSMHAKFKNITSSCTEPNCATCASDDFECFVLDDNGYVIVSNDMADTGRFFGEVRGAAMRQMIEEKIYERVTIFDYQAICFVNKDSSNIAGKLIAVRNLFFY
jgi:voltage-dependent calcium channel alpha-2/delta-3